ncbi:hypothetical protein [Caballeronia sp. HLA56]
MMASLQAGFRLIDEVHSDFHLNFKIDLYKDCQRSLSLSATLMCDDAFMPKIYEIAHPTRLRYRGEAYDNYASATALFYRLQEPEKIRYQDPISKNYSYHLFERLILLDSERAYRYLSLIESVVVDKYIKRRAPDEKLIVFAAGIETCTILTDYLRATHSEIDVRRYAEKDPFMNVINADVRVTTLLSAATAVDIPNLIINTMTVTVSSQCSNV